MIDAWNDEKWINLRATPHALADAPGSVQWDGIMSNITASKLEQQETAAFARPPGRADRAHRAGQGSRSAPASRAKSTTTWAATSPPSRWRWRCWPSACRADQPQLADKAAYVDALVDRTIEAMHRISLDLRPSMLDFGIVAALEWQVRANSKSRSASPAAFACDDKEIDLAQRPCRRAVPYLPGSADQYRQACAGQPGDGHACSAARNELALAIADNGVGIAPADRLKPQSFGLRGMSERAKALGGTMALSQAPGGGTIVTIKTTTKTDDTGRPTSSAIMTEKATIRVFIADDHAIVREGLKQILADSPDIIVAGEAENGARRDQAVPQVQVPRDAARYLDARPERHRRAQAGQEGKPRDWPC